MYACCQSCTYVRIGAGRVVSVEKPPMVVVVAREPLEGQNSLFTVTVSTALSRTIDSESVRLSRATACTCTRARQCDTCLSPLTGDTIAVLFFSSDPAVFPCFTVASELGERQTSSRSERRNRCDQNLL